MRLTKYYFFFLLTVSNWILLSPIQAQVELLMNIPSPNSPFLSEWMENPAVGNLMLLNHSGQPLELVFHVALQHDRFGQILQATSAPTELSGMGQSFGNRDISDINWILLSWNQDIESSAFRTGRFPEGRYTLCIEVSLDKRPLASECADFEILFPDPPQLLTPEDRSIVQIPQPVFLWTPIILPRSIEVSYKITIKPILPGQHPFQAIRANFPNLELTVPSTSLPYPLEGQPLEENSRYVWNVQAVDEDGNPITRNEGYSEIFTFIQQPLTLPDFDTEETLISYNIQTPPIIMNGRRTNSISVQTNPIFMEGRRINPLTVQTNSIIMNGCPIQTAPVEFIPFAPRMVTRPITMNGRRHQYRRILTLPITMNGRRIHYKRILTRPIYVDRAKSEPGRVLTATIAFQGRRIHPTTILTGPILMKGRRIQPKTIVPEALIFIGTNQ